MKDEKKTVGRDTSEPKRSGRPRKTSESGSGGQRTENPPALAVGSVKRVYLGRYCAKMNVFAMDGWLYIAEDSPQYVMWGEYRPVAFTSPGMDE